MSPDRHKLRSNELAVLATCVAAVVALAALPASVGADARWLAALGHLVASHHAIPAGVPFAADAAAHWPNVPVLAELIFYWLERALGDQGLVLAQLLAVAVATALLMRDSLSGGANPGGTARAAGLAAIGSITGLAIARGQLFSIALLPLVCLILRRESRNPSRRIWAVVPLLAVWANLHGAVLIGLALVLCYLLLERVRTQRLVAAAVALASVAAVCLTPSLLHTLDYYRGVLANAAAARGQGMWAPLSPTAPQDVLLILAAVVLGWKFIAARPRLWEWAAAGALLVMTIHASRSGMWLLFFMTPTAARGLKAFRAWERMVPVAAATAVGAIGFALVRGPVQDGASPRLVSRALSLSHGLPILAGEGIDEQVSLAGGSILIGNPIDAFSRSDQNRYLDWLSGRPGGRRLLGTPVRVVLVLRGSAAQTLMARTPGFAAAAGDRNALLYERN